MFKVKRMFKRNNKTPERSKWRRYGVFVYDLENSSHLVLIFLMLTLNM